MKTTSELPAESGVSVAGAPLSALSGLLRQPIWVEPRQPRPKIWGEVFCISYWKELELCSVKKHCGIPPPT
jgi:hypothetical protein